MIKIVLNIIVLNLKTRHANISQNEGHHPHIHLNFKNVEVIIFTHKINGLHENDFILAAKIDNI